MACGLVGSLASSVGGEDVTRLGIIVCDSARVPPETLAAARHEASRVLSKAGIEIRWLDCSPSQVTDVKDVEQGIACHRPHDPARIVLEILRQPVSVKASRGEVHGFARIPGDGRQADCAGVFYERAEGLAVLGEASRAQILGHVVAHEIGHVLLGARSHSPRGIMRPEWSRADLARAAWGRLTFEPGQTASLQAGAQSRVTGQAFIPD